MSLAVQENHPLAPLTYYKIGGNARYMITPSNKEELLEASDFIAKKNLPVFILGAGSNLIVSDDGFSGIVLNTSKLNSLLKLQENTLCVGASVLVIKVLRLCMQEGIKGLELLAGIPGSMGGVFFMNAGTHLGEIQSCIEELTLYNLESKKFRTLTQSEMKYSYRKNHFINKNDLIYEGKIRIQSGKPAEEVQKTITDLLEKRKKSQPIDKPSCGSVFKNPDPKNGVFAWKLIDEAGLRGLRIGNAQISPVHCNFIVNLGGATAKDVLNLIQTAKKTVLEKFGIELEEEVLTV